MKRVLVASVVWLAVSAAPVLAQDRHQKNLEHMLKRLDPSTRLEQVCDAEAMKQIGRDHREFRIDRSVVSAIMEPRVKGDTLSGKGAAFRSRGKWYQYAFTCQATPDRLRVLSFQYKLGDEIPEAQWSQHGLYQ
jgi:hypothetical protein